MFTLAFCDRKVVIILEIDVIKRAEEVAGRIGEPTPYTEGKTLKHPLFLCTDLNRVELLAKMINSVVYCVQSSLQVKVKIKHLSLHQPLIPGLLYSPRTGMKVSDGLNVDSQVLLASGRETL